MRVLHVVQSLDPRTGGPAVSVPRTAQVQQMAGAHVVIACHKGGAPRPHGAWVHEGLLGFGGDMPRSIARRAAWCDVLHGHGLWLGCNHMAARAAHHWGRTLVISPRGMLEPWSLAQGRWKKRAALMLYEGGNLRRAAGFHATSEAEVESIRRRGLRQPIALVPNGVDLPDGSPAVERGPVRRALFLSRLHRKKGVAELIASWRRLSPAGWELVIAGEGSPDDTRRFRQMAGTETTAPIRFHGFVAGADKARLFASAELFVLPTWSENFGIVVAEALAHGLPVITTTATPWQALEGLKAGWIVEPGQMPLEQALAQAVSRSPRELGAMGARGREHVRENYSWQRTGHGLLEFYRWLEDRQSTPRPEFVR